MNLSSQIDLLLCNINARLSSDGDDKCTPFQHALAAADAALQQEYLRYSDEGADKPRRAAYLNVLEVLVQARYPATLPENVERDAWTTAYDGEIGRLRAIVERALLGRLDPFSNDLASLRRYEETPESPRRWTRGGGLALDTERASSI